MRSRGLLFFFFSPLPQRALASPCRCVRSRLVSFDRCGYPWACVCMHAHAVDFSVLLCFINVLVCRANVFFFVFNLCSFPQTESEARAASERDFLEMSTAGKTRVLYLEQWKAGASARLLRLQQRLDVSVPEQVYIYVLRVCHVCTRCLGR